MDSPFVFPVTLAPNRHDRKRLSGVAIATKHQGAINRLFSNLRYRRAQKQRI
jgi:hypothetical protein